MNIILYTITFYLIKCHNPFNYSLPTNLKRELDQTSINLTSIDWSPLRIHFEYLQSNFDNEYTTYLDKVFSITQTFFQRYLLVRRINNTLQYQSSQTTWYGFEISDTLKSQTYNADFVIFVNVENNQNSNYLAYAGPIIYEQQTFRPIFAILSWNMYYTNVINTTNVEFELSMETAIHELTHALGFIDNFFSLYYDSVTGQSYQSQPTFEKNGTTYLSTPRILNLAQYYFNCSSMTGVQMENNGGSGTAGSHLERSLFYNELMTGSDITGNFLITDFTFQIYQDTGFYRVMDYSPDTIRWGQNEGCAFVNSYCNGGDFQEFCSSYGSYGCSFYQAGQSTCIQDGLTDSCMYQYILSNFDCRDADSIGDVNDASTFQYYGYDSMCLQGSLSTTNIQKSFSCYQYSCSSSNVLSIIVNGQTYQCNEADQIINADGYQGVLYCPKNYDTFCQGVDECPNQCNQKGICLNKQCVCMLGYSGQGCTDTCSNYRYNSQCYTQCPVNTYALDDIKYCVGCPANCISCTNYNLCTTCQQGYQLRGGFCDNYNLFSTQDNSTTDESTDESDDSENQTDESSNNSTDTSNQTITSQDVYISIKIDSILILNILFLLI